MSDKTGIEAAVTRLALLAEAAHEAWGEERWVAEYHGAWVVKLDTSRYTSVVVAGCEELAYHIANNDPAATLRWCEHARRMLALAERDKVRGDFATEIWSSLACALGIGP